MEPALGVEPPIETVNPGAEFGEVIGAAAIRAESQVVVIRGLPRVRNIRRRVRPLISLDPTGNNSGTGGTGFPSAPATDGLRNITGVVNSDGTATIYAHCQ
jgi:hypothetical protein